MSTTAGLQDAGWDAVSWSVFEGETPPTIETNRARVVPTTLGDKECRRDQPGPNSCPFVRPWSAPCRRSRDFHGGFVRPKGISGSNVTE